MILSSPEFLFFQVDPGLLPEKAFKERLAYFLLNGPPSAHASESSLSPTDREEVSQAVDRLLADPKSERTKSAVARCVGIATNDGRTGKRKALFGADYMNDPLLGIGVADIADAEIRRVLFKRGKLRSALRIFDSDLAARRIAPCGCGRRAEGPDLSDRPVRQEMRWSQGGQPAKGSPRYEEGPLPLAIAATGGLRCVWAFDDLSGDLGHRCDRAVDVSGQASSKAANAGTGLRTR